MTARTRNPSAEAAATVGPGWKPLVLEPSPPAVLHEPFADDPLAASADDPAVVSPIERPGSVCLSWAALVEQEPDLIPFAAERWLAAWPRLKPLPTDFATTRLGLHRAAAYLVSPARRKANGKIGLRHTQGGFGTPFFVVPGDDPTCSSQVRVDGTTLVVQRGSETTVEPLTTLNQGGELLGFDPDTEWASGYDIPEPGGLDDDLGIKPEGAAAVAAWCGFAFSVLEQVRADVESVEASIPQLWPEHFDPAIEVGSEQNQQRASYGLSPGDVEGSQQSPYLYVSVWYPDNLADDPFWNSETFPGATLPYEALLAADDQRTMALDFFRTGRNLLIG
ncbi:MAG: hypothetical protein GY939_29335 [Actinomycetia bacterium]|nr:hypothetical protein [Actinomycetes bacterium]